VTYSRSTVNVRGENRVLALVGAAERQRIVQRCEKVRLPQHTVVYRANSEIGEVYFPVSGMASLVMSTEDGQTVEVGMIGNEGMIGTPLVLGASRSPADAVVQVESDFLRMARKDLELELNAGSALRSAAQRFSQALANQVAQSVLCNRLHSVEQRLCRWFVMTHDRVASDEIFLTHQFVAQMLGVRRASVTVAVGVLQKAGLVSYSRERLVILNRPGLEAGACECYEVVQAELERLLKA
jgi:CRP-like cAMP-binding protein